MRWPLHVSCAWIRGTAAVAASSARAAVPGYCQRNGPHPAPEAVARPSVVYLASWVCVSRPPSALPPQQFQGPPREAPAGCSNSPLEHTQFAVYGTMAVPQPLDQRRRVGEDGFCYQPCSGSGLLLRPDRKRDNFHQPESKRYPFYPENAY